MFRSPISREPSSLDKAIDNVYDRLLNADQDSEEYPKLLQNLERLNAMKQTASKGVSRDTVWLVLGNLAGILIIVAYENKHVFTSKGLAQLLKLKP